MTYSKCGIVSERQSAGTPQGGIFKPFTVSIAEAARMSGFSQSAVRRAVRDGAIPSIKVGRLIRVPRIPLMRLLGVAGGDETPP
jgi:excisionase family DNA binding protein